MVHSLVMLADCKYTIKMFAVKFCLFNQVAFNNPFESRVRSDVPGYLSDSDADGVTVIKWYHRQFKDAAKERYFKTFADDYYFHSMMADRCILFSYKSSMLATNFRFITEFFRHKYLFLSRAKFRVVSVT